MRSRSVMAWTAVISLGLAAAVAADARAQQTDEQLELMNIERFEEGDPNRGAPLYKRYCSGCHGADGRGGAHTFMPHISNLTREDYIEFIPDGFLYIVIAEGGEAVGKSAYMPAWKSKLSEQDIKDIIAHIRTLPTY